MLAQPHAMQTMTPIPCYGGISGNWTHDLCLGIEMQEFASDMISRVNEVTLAATATFLLIVCCSYFQNQNV
jgi:hypothetical protein